MTIIFYDILSTLPGNTCSPNTWKTRYCLNFKGLAYKTEWVELSDIEGHCKKLGIAPTSIKPNGEPYYSLPAIYDLSTGAYISDSLLIAEYLERTYPSTPSIFPRNTMGLQWSFSNSLSGSLSALWAFILPVVCMKLNPVSEAYFRRTREAMFGVTMEDFVPKGEAAVEQWGKFKDALGKVDTWYSKSGGPYLLGDTVSWADFVVAGYIIWMRIVWGEDSQQWKDISSWHEGRWKKLVDDFKKYETLD